MMTIALEEKTIIAICGTCETEFEAFCVGLIQQKHCDACVAAVDARIASYSSHRVTTAEKASCVPVGYQCFDSGLLPENTRRLAHSKIFTWNFGPVGIGLGGQSRQGKSFVIFELARRWQDAGKRVAVIKDQDIAGMVRTNSDERERLIDDVRRAEIVVWDDFGSAKMTDAVEGTYNDLLEKINSRNLPIFGTTNFGGEQIKQKWASDMKENTLLGDRGEKMVGRFRERCRIFSLQCSATSTI